MSEDGTHPSHERLWKAQEAKEVQLTLNEVCAKAR